MFRHFYAEQNMADPRDSWYKPNLLYNIHHRPSKPTTPPKLMIVTKEFNPSVCTCGEHGCVPHYRIEREIVWLNKKVTNERDRERKELNEIIQAERDAKAQTEIAIDGYDDSCEDDEEEDDDCDGAYGEDGKEWESEECAEDMVDGIKGMAIEMNETEGGNLPNCLPKFDDLTKGDKPEPDVLHTASDTSVRQVEEDEEFGSAFGIMSVYCDSDLHTWKWKNEIPE